MFKSKSFTAAFAVMSVVIVGLIVLLCYLLFGKGGEELISGYQIASVEDTDAETDSSESDTSEATTSTEPETTSEEETETEEETTEEVILITDDSLRALSADEEHQYPVIGEVIPETGVITIIKSGDRGEGIVFHKEPKFDGSDSPGNVVNYNGSFDISGKIYIMDNDRPFLMYQTVDGYYCTSSTTYMSYQANQRTINSDGSKIGAFGVGETEGVELVVHSEDGNHVCFSLLNYDSTSQLTTPLLENLVAVYNSLGVAAFEYHYTDGNVYTGTISFEKREGDDLGSLIVDINFTQPIMTEKGERTEIVLHK